MALLGALGKKLITPDGDICVELTTSSSTSSVLRALPTDRIACILRGEDSRWAPEARNAAVYQTDIGGRTMQGRLLPEPSKT